MPTHTPPGAAGGEQGGGYSQLTRVVAAAVLVAAIMAAVVGWFGNPMNSSPESTAMTAAAAAAAAATTPPDPGDPRPYAAAVKLAALINLGDPVDVRDHLSDAELSDALGTLVPGPHGWRRRVGSFLELLDPMPPERWTEKAIRALPASSGEAEILFAAPLLITRSRGGVARVATGRMTLEALRKDNPMVRPSRASTLAVAYGPNPRDAAGGWNHKLMPFANDCPEW